MVLVEGCAGAVGRKGFAPRANTHEAEGQLARSGPL